MVLFHFLWVNELCFYFCHDNILQIEWSRHTQKLEYRKTKIFLIPPSFHTAHNNPLLPLPPLPAVMVTASPVWSSWYLSIFEKRCFRVQSIFVCTYIYTQTYLYRERQLFLYICINKYIHTEIERGRHYIWLTITRDRAIINSAGLFLIFTGLTEIWMWPIMYRLTNQRTSRLIFYGYRIICTP